jgi:hypothetical protein
MSEIIDFGGTFNQYFLIEGNALFNIPPFGIGCQCYLLELFILLAIDFKKKKTTRCIFLAVFKQSDGGAGGN